MASRHRYCTTHLVLLCLLPVRLMASNRRQSPFLSEEKKKAKDSFLCLSPDPSLPTVALPWQTAPSVPGRALSSLLCQAGREPAAVSTSPAQEQRGPGFKPGCGVVLCSGKG